MVSGAPSASATSVPVFFAAIAPIAPPSRPPISLPRSLLRDLIADHRAGGDATEDLRRVAAALAGAALVELAADRDPLPAGRDEMVEAQGDQRRGADVAAAGDDVRDRAGERRARGDGHAAIRGEHVGGEHRLEPLARVRRLARQGLLQRDGEAGAGRHLHRPRRRGRPRPSCRRCAAARRCGPRDRAPPSVGRGALGGQPDAARPRPCPAPPGPALRRPPQPWHAPPPPPVRRFRPRPPPPPSPPPAVPSAPVRRPLPRAPRSRVRARRAGLRGPRLGPGGCGALAAGAERETQQGPASARGVARALAAFDGWIEWDIAGFPPGCRLRLTKTLLQPDRARNFAGRRCRSVELAPHHAPPRCVQGQDALSWCAAWRHERDRPHASPGFCSERVQRHASCTISRPHNEDHPGAGRANPPGVQDLAIHTEPI
jgi:hypothetical protein